MPGKKYIIEVPNPHFSGVREGLLFEDGKAETEDKKLAEYLTDPGNHFGYFCAELGKPAPGEGKEKGKSKKEKEKDQEPKPLESRSKKELLAYAKEHYPDLEFKAKATQKEIFEAIIAAMPSDPPEKEEDQKTKD